MKVIELGGERISKTWENSNENISLILAFLEKEIELFVDILRFVESDVRTSEFCDSMTETLQFIGSLRYVLHTFFLVQCIEKYSCSRMGYMFTSSDERIFKGIEYMHEYTVVLSSDRTEMDFVQSFHTIREDEDEMVFDTLLVELFEDHIER